MRVTLLVAGGLLIAVGAAGVRYAPAIVAAQHREAMTPFEDERLDSDDRIRVTRGVGVLLALVGVGLVAAGLEVLG